MKVLLADFVAAVCLSNDWTMAIRLSADYMVVIRLSADGVVEIQLSPIQILFDWTTIGWALVGYLLETNRKFC